MAEARPHILIAVDGSDRAPLVLEWGIRSARERGAGFTVVRVVGLAPETPADVIGLDPAEVLNRLCATARAELDKLIAEAGVPHADARVEVGSVVPTLLMMADDLRIDLLVLGAHGYRFAERVFGTTAGRLVERSKVSVLVVR